VSDTVKSSYGVKRGNVLTQPGTKGKRVTKVDTTFTEDFIMKEKSVITRDSLEIKIQKVTDTKKLDSLNRNKK
jgi:hypothetical protein